MVWVRDAWETVTVRGRCELHRLHGTRGYCSLPCLFHIKNNSLSGRLNVVKFERIEKPRRANSRQNRNDHHYDDQFHEAEGAALRVELHVGCVVSYYPVLLNTFSDRKANARLRAEVVGDQPDGSQQRKRAENLIVLEHELVDVDLLVEKLEQLPRIDPTT